MSYQEANGWCKRCRDHVLIRRPVTSDLVNVLLLIFSGGLWLPFWILGSLHRAKWRCTRCGSPASCPEFSASDAIAFAMRLGIALVIIGSAVTVLWIVLTSKQPPPSVAQGTIPTPKVVEPAQLPVHPPKDSLVNEPAKGSEAEILPEEPIDPLAQMQTEIDAMQTEIERYQTTLSSLRKKNAELIAFDRAMDKVKLYEGAKDLTEAAAAAYATALAKAKEAGTFSDAEVKAFRNEEKGLVEQIALLSKQRDAKQATLNKEKKP